MGEKIRQARLQAGLTQKQLSGDRITRNMLSQIENEQASASIGTLRYLAERLQKPVSYFLEEAEDSASNTMILDAAWEEYRKENYSAVFSQLDLLPTANAGMNREMTVLRCLTLLAQAKQALSEKRIVYARELIGKEELLEADSPWYPEIRQQRLLLLAQIPGNPAKELPDLDEALMLHAGACLTSGDFSRAAALLDCAEDQSLPRWNLLRANAAFEMKSYSLACSCYQKAERMYPQKAIPRLEICFREQGDYQNAYLYACKCRDLGL